ncbi:MAG: hypothetical protein PHY80_03475 [Rickettsiales bacterium]|nr:hypothetical protein [Rickettsiales bacterium]
MLNFKDIKQNFFVNYSRYWIVFFTILIIFLFYNYRIYHFQTDNISKNIKNAVYIGSGVVINKHNIIVNKELMDHFCIGKYSGLRGKMFAMDKKHTIEVVPIVSNSILNITVLGTKRNEDTFNSYALFDMNNFDYNSNNEVIVPKTLNRSGYFDFKKGKISQINNNTSNFFVSVKNTSKKDALLGMPVFNKNYILLGIIRSINENITSETKRDRILNKSSVQKTYLTNGIESIKKFLDSKYILYFMISGDFNFGKEKYNIDDSLVDIICIERY